MKIKNVVLTGILAGAAAGFALKGLLDNKELAEKAKVSGKKVFDDSKELGNALKEAVNESADTAKVKAKELYQKAKTKLEELKNEADLDFMTEDEEEDAYNEECEDISIDDIQSEVVKSASVDFEEGNEEN